MGESVEPRECIACMLIRDGMLLAEKRKLTKTVVPGAVALPGGHLEAGEQPEEAVQRELEEELGIAPVEVRYVCTLLHRSQEFRKLHYFVVTQWEGNIRNREAASLMWLPFTALQELDLDVDRLAVAEYLRVYGEP